MNKTILFFITIILFIGTTLLASEMTIDETKEMLGGHPVKIAEWMGKNIKGIREDFQYAQPAERTFKYKKGDCEDWAILSRYFIGNKYETHLIIWAGKFRKDSKYYMKYKKRMIIHCVLAIKLAENDWGIIDNDKFIAYGTTLAEIIKINCDLRKINIEKAHIADLYKYKNEIIKEIDLEEEDE